MWIYYLRWYEYSLQLCYRTGQYILTIHGGWNQFQSNKSAKDTTLEFCVRERIIFGEFCCFRKMYDSFFMEFNLRPFATCKNISVRIFERLFFMFLSNWMVSTLLITWVLLMASGRLLILSFTYHSCPCDFRSS